MANKIAEIPVLESILKKRFHKVDGKKIEIGHFWSVLQIYLCMRTLNVSIATICKVASMMDGRLDSKYRLDEEEINPSMMRRYLLLKSSPTQSAHTVVTKQVSRGASQATEDALSDILVKYNSFGKDIIKDIMDHLDQSKGELISTRFSVMGNSSFSQVLKVCLVLTEMYKQGIIGDMSEVSNSEHLDTIITNIQERQNELRVSGTIGFDLGGTL